MSSVCMASFDCFYDNEPRHDQFSLYEPRHEKTCFFAYAKTKAQTSCTVTAQLISAFVFAT